jgi:hypothetical protein
MTTPCMFRVATLEASVATRESAKDRHEIPVIRFFAVITYTSPFNHALFLQIACFLEHRFLTDPAFRISLPCFALSFYV